MRTGSVKDGAYNHKYAIGKDTYGSVVFTTVGENIGFRGYRAWALLGYLPEKKKYIVDGEYGTRHYFDLGEAVKARNKILYGGC